MVNFKIEIYKLKKCRKFCLKNTRYRTRQSEPTQTVIKNKYLQ